MRVPDEVRQCVVFVGRPVTASSGAIDATRVRYSGTAFFATVPSEAFPTDVQYLYLVTAKHVAVQLQGGFVLRVNTPTQGSTQIIATEDVPWWYHPTDASADVAVIPISAGDYEFKTIPLSMFLTDDVIREQSIGAGDEVFITGLFTHLTGTDRNLPIVRMGNVAMMPTEPVPTSLGDIEAYLIEARSIGGLSGSPAFVRQTVGVGIGNFYLLGLMHGHWDIPPEARDDALVDEAVQGQAFVNLGIAIVVPAKKIRETLFHPHLVELRTAHDETIRSERKPTMDAEMGKGNAGSADC